ncbi:hypothetical protein [Trichothermofontia sp.]
MSNPLGRRSLREQGDRTGYWEENWQFPLTKGRSTGHYGIRNPGL